MSPKLWPKPFRVCLGSAIIYRSRTSWLHLCAIWFRCAGIRHTCTHSGLFTLSTLAGGGGVLFIFLKDRRPICLPLIISWRRYPLHIIEHRFQAEGARPGRYWLFCTDFPILFSQCLPWSCRAGLHIRPDTYSQRWASRRIVRPRSTW